MEVQQTRVTWKYSGQLMTRKLPTGIIGWKQHRHMAQGIFQNFSNWMKVGTFLKINKGVKSCPAGNPRTRQVFNHTPYEHQNNIK